MSKTPVSILQEYMQKNGIGTPDYIIVSDKKYSSETSFTYRVNCSNFSALGTASSKKEAKHKAAREMLKLLPTNIPLDSFYSSNHNGILEDDNFVNSVGKLSEYCASRRFKSPEYTVVEASGPSHLMTFKIKCSIGSLSVDASASTKKQAKHDAAQNMYHLLIKTTTSKTHPDLFQSNLINQVCKESEEAIANVEILDLKTPDLLVSSKQSEKRAMELYPKLRDRLSVNIVKDVPVKEYHEALKKSQLTSNREIAQKKLRISSSALSNESLLTKVLDILGLQLDSQILVGRVKDCIYRCTINSSPVITDVGIGKTVDEARERAIENLLNSIDLLLA